MTDSLRKKYPDEIKRILDKYPADQKRSAVMPLLYMAQREDTYVTKSDLEEIAEILDMSTTEVASIVGFYSLYYDEPAGTYRVQVCTDLPCALRGAEQFLEKLCDNLGIQVGETTQDGLVTVEHVMCLAGCDRSPMFQLQSGKGLEYYEDQTVESALAMIEKLRSVSKDSVSPGAGHQADSKGIDTAGELMQGNPTARKGEG